MKDDFRQKKRDLPFNWLQKKGSSGALKAHNRMELPERGAVTYSFLKVAYERLEQHSPWPISLS